MGRKAKVKPEIKLKVVEDYLEGKVSLKIAAIKLGFDKSSIRGLIRKYKAFGSEGLLTISRNTYYPNELKIQAITDYIDGKGALSEICMQYKIASKEIKRYGSY